MGTYGRATESECAIHDPHVLKTEGFQIGDHRLSTWCGVVEWPDHHCGDDLVLLFSLKYFAMKMVAWPFEFCFYLICNPRYWHFLFCFRHLGLPVSLDIVSFSSIETFDSGKWRECG